jgi:multidrug resistance efflux pump
MLRQKRLAPIVVFYALAPVVASAQMPATRVVVAQARRMTAPSTITVVGTVEPVRRSRVSTEIGGRVAEMPVRQGDFVPTDGILCRLDTDILTLRLAEEQAKLEALRAQHEELLAGTRPEELMRLEALKGEAEALYERWKFEMARIEGLYKGRDSNDKEYQDTRAELIAAERRKVAAEAAYRLGLEGPRKEVIARAAFEVAEQQAVVDQIATDLEKATTRAPFAGYVVKRSTEVGEWIPLGGPVAEMIDLSSVLIRVDMPESALPYLRVGQDARVLVDALGRAFTGSVKHIMRQADPSARTFPVELHVANEEGLLAGGMFARATLPSGAEEEVTAVPKDAVLIKEGVTYVALVIPGRDGTPHGVLAPVTAGADVGEWIAVAGGNVREGAAVITRGTERMLPFPSPIEIVDEHGRPATPPQDGTGPAAGGNR